ncbi:uncharacterized protein BYT42DRAFT_563851 [Radiomyces spectabilis]|uniref:uncharacterized protein n=1 Tax=Radiomyces spectabilis TaxID=64574 RepID=UPI00221E595A|nr:uncharacterized protein BYT42DRAFT_563851 [Radiomyces spectabilis]KAI8384849.1 hypothetical protein BYT42DRAFT_563851 [Radiomyces spectabilis]
MKVTFLAILTFFVALIAAQKEAFYVTSPLKGSKFKPGDVIHINWLNGIDEEVKVVLIGGTSPDRMQPVGHTFNVNGSDGYKDWEVPKDLQPNVNYAFQFQYKAQNGSTEFAYSDPFTLEGSASGSASSNSASSTSSRITAATTDGAVATGSSSVSSVAPSSVASSSVAPSSAASPAASSPASSGPASPSVEPTTSASLTPEPEKDGNAAAGLRWTAVAICAPAILAAVFLS